MKLKELRALPKAELTAKQQELRKELLKAHAHIAVGAGLPNPGKVRVARKTLARINALLSAPPAAAVQQGAQRRRVTQ